MSVFGNYSRYYDLLYRDKDYRGEADYVHALIERHRPGAKTLLDLGCGTGRHASLLAERGYDVVGVDRSPAMLDEARARKVTGGRTEFVEGDLRSVRLARKFDVVVSLFHVMSYQTTNADLLAGLATLRAHLAPGGLFIFDCWYGPAVLHLRPAVRVLRLEDAATEVTRLAEPVVHPNDNVVDVNYHVFVKDKKTSEVSELREKHAMRYLFAPEIAHFLSSAGLSQSAVVSFMSDAPPGLDTWTAVFLGGAAE
ncbi:MAG TPA: class I SAM-dependent methyltransferase [Polyangiaceae bacterium]|nr:class I SAM-dependent methyltransferase [Polyangiaceae bacterium]